MTAARLETGGLANAGVSMRQVNGLYLCGARLKGTALPHWRSRASRAEIYGGRMEGNSDLCLGFILAGMIFLFALCIAWVGA